MKRNVQICEYDPMMFDDPVLGIHSNSPYGQKKVTEEGPDVQLFCLVNNDGN